MKIMKIGIVLLLLVLLAYAGWWLYKKYIAKSDKTVVPGGAGFSSSGARAVAV